MGLLLKNCKTCFRKRDGDAGQALHEGKPNRKCRSKCRSTDRLRRFPAASYPDVRLKFSQRDHALFPPEAHLVLEEPPHVHHQEAGQLGDAEAPPAWGTGGGSE